MRVHALYKGGLAEAPALLAGLTAAGATVTALESDSVEHVPELLAGPDIDRVVVVGGDGMIHQAVQQVAGTRTALAIVPAGTGNDIARALGIGKGLKAIDRALGPSAPMDLIRATDDNGATSWIVSVLTAGFSGDVTARANQMTLVSGQSKYTLATLACLPRLRAHKLTVDGQPRDTALVAVGNTRFFGGGMAICPAAAPFDSQLDVVVVDAVNPLHLALVLPAAYVGQHIRSRRVHSRRASGVSLESRSGWWADGEELDLGHSITAESVAGAVQMC